MPAVIMGLGLLACLAAGNGANDVSRAAATLVGAGIAPYRRVLVWVAAWTMAGSLGSGLLAAGVGQRFAVAMAANGGAQADIAFAVIVSAAAWVYLATYIRLPVATTHAVLGALVGAAWFSGGWDACLRLGLLWGFVLPLMTSPLIAAAVAAIGQFCIGTVRKAEGPWVDRIHWLSSGLVAFSRGVNDSAKIWALLLPLAVLGGLPGPAATDLGILLVAGSMLMGSLLSGHRVTETFAFGIRRMGHVDSAVANLSTAAVIIGASLASFPVASSHVVGGAILGSGLASARQGIVWRTLLEMVTAWALTLPAVAIASAGLLFTARCLPPAIFGGASVILVAGGALLATCVVARAVALNPSLAVWRPLMSQFEGRLIVFVCNSNTSRSPMAAGICQALLKSRTTRTKGGRSSAISRGLSVVSGTSMTPPATDALVRLGIKVGPHRSIDLDEAIATRASVIFCMTGHQEALIRQMFPSASAKIRRLLDGHDIDDPSAGGRMAYDAVAKVLHDAVSARLAEA